MNERYSKLCDLEWEIIHWHDQLHDRGVWLFLATVGCWGVTEYFFRLASFLITGVIFAWTIWKAREEKTPFKERLVEFAEPQPDDSFVVADTRRRLMTTYLSFPLGLPTGFIFQLGVAYWFLSFVYLIYTG